MSPAQMFNLVRHWYENVLSGAVAVHGQGRTGGWNESESNLSRLFTPDYVNHVTPAPKDGWKRGIAGALQIMQIYRLSSPDLAIKVEEQMVCGDKVITRYIAEGTHTGRPFFNIPATSKRHKVTGIAIDRIANGKFAESWGQWDLTSLLSQMGILPEGVPALG